MSKKLRNRLRAITFDGCMFPDSVMHNPSTWDDVLNLGVRVLETLMSKGLPMDQVPALHVGVWARFVGRGAKSELGLPISFHDMLTKVETARSSGGAKFEGIDLIEGADVAEGISDSEFAMLVSRLKSSNLVVGDIVASTWPNEEAGEGGAFGSEKDRERMVAAVGRACRLWHRFAAAGVASYGSIRVDSGEGPEKFDTNRELHQERLVGTFQAMADEAATYDKQIVVEGETCWGGQAGYMQCVNLLQQAGRDNLLFQADTAHLVHFLAATNVNPGDSLLPKGVVVYDPKDPEIKFEVPKGVRQATRAELMAGWAQLADILSPYIGSFHFAQSRGTLFGAGTHAKTGRHCPALDPKGIVDVPAVAALMLLA